MKFLIAERISANKYKTPEGYLVCVDSVLARTGKQTYRKNEIFVDCDDETEIEVDRKPEEVFSEATLASFENKPITIEHPDEDVNTGNFKTLAVGFVRDIHRGKDNGQDVMLGTLVITDEEAISAVESGELLDLSCGYDCDIEDSANPQQKNIRGNHVALCENGRAGIARIVDSVKDNDELPEEEDSTFRYSGARGEEIFVTNYDGRNTFLVSGGKSRYDEKMMQRRDVERYLNEHGAKFSKVIDSIEDEKTFKIGWVRNSTDRAAYTEVSAKSAEEAKKKLKKYFGKEVYRIFECKTNDSEETEMKDKLIDIPSDILGKIESLFKARNIKITGKGKTWTGRVHYQVEFVGKAIDLKKKLDLIEEQVESLKIPMTYAIGSNKEDTLATAGVDFGKQHVADSDAEDGKNAAENAVESAMSELNIDVSKLQENKDKVIMKISSKGLYGRTQAGWFVDDYIKNHVNDSDVEDEDLITKAINDEVTAIELYNQILAGDLDEHTRAIIEEIRDDENDHLVKLTKLKNNVGSDEDIEDSASEFNKYLARIEKAAKNKDKKLLAEVKQAIMYAPTSRLKNSEASELFDKVKEIEKSISDEEKVDDAIQTFEIRWIDTYKKSKGYVKEEYLHIDKIKASTLSEALKKLADNVALTGVGTMNAMIVSIHSDKASYMYSGKLGELVHKVKDSSKIERAINAIRAMRKI